jgi:hypothetical protein
MRKKEPKSILAPSEKKMVQTCLDNRARIHQGLKLLKHIIHDNSSKIAIMICACLAKKIKSINK